MARTLPRRRSIHYNADEADTDLERWRGSKDVGWEIVKAKQHAEGLYQFYHKRPADVAHKIVMDIFGTQSDPNSDPGNRVTAEAWEKLPGAIDAANEACEHIMRAYDPDDAKAMRCLWYAENLYFSLTEAEFLVNG